ncbi:MAG: hypothetical protein ABL926_05440 [Novosphingobium sp.]|uniref:hypothetical protein n=1 Tax=Novosphingobium sp. TaxID=1874826 RepID=UPI0032B7114F
MIDMYDAYMFGAPDPIWDDLPVGDGGVVPSTPPPPLSFSTPIPWQHALDDVAAFFANLDSGTLFPEGGYENSS